MLEEFLKLVSDGDYEGLKVYTDSNKEKITQYVQENVPALQTALDNQHFAVFSLLQSKGFPLPSNDEKNNINVNLVNEIMNSYCIYINDNVVVDGCRPDDLTKLPNYTDLPIEEIWVDCSWKLMEKITTFVEFVKSTPFFMRLLTEDLITFLHHGMFAICICRWSRHIILSQNAVRHGRITLPRDVFYSSDNVHMKFLAEIFETMKSIAELKLTDVEMALYQSLIFVWPEQNDGAFTIVNKIAVTKLFNEILAAMEYELEKRGNQEDGSLFNILFSKIPKLRELSLTHRDLLKRILVEKPEINFPEFYKDTFGL